MVSISTVHCRLRNVRVLASPRDLVLLQTRAIGETDLITGTSNGSCTLPLMH